jgi:hypothetical protein
MIRTMFCAAACCAVIGAGCKSKSAALCEFTAAQNSTKANFVGPPELFAQTLVTFQPGAPTAIVQVDLNGINNILADDETMGSYGVEVRNVSNAILSRVTVMLHVVSDRESGGLASRFDGPLDPGATAWIRGIGKIHWSRDEGQKTRVAVAVDSVVLGGCLYKPAQEIPMDWVSRVRALRE